MTLLSRAVSNMIAKAPQAVRVPMSMAGMMGSLQSAFSGATLNRAQQLGQMASVSWLFAVVDRIAATTAGVEWHLYRKQRSGERLEVMQHEALSLWQRPNEFMTRFDLVEALVQHFCLVGEMWIHKARPLNRPGARPLELWPLRPDMIAPVPGYDVYCLGYVYGMGATKIPFECSDIIYRRRPNPVDPYRGLGAVQGLLLDLDAERYTNQWERNFFINGARPGGVIQFNKKLDAAEWEEFVQRWREGHQGVGNAHRVAVLENATWQDVKYTMRDLQFKDIRQVRRDVILGAYGMPRAVLGISEDMSRANAEASHVAFTQFVIKPILRRIQEGLNTALLPEFGTDLEFDFENPVPDDAEARRETAKIGYETQSLEQNEIRELLGFDAREGGDVIIVPLSAGGAVTKGSDSLLSPALERAETRMRQAWEKRLAEQKREIVGLLEDME